jgi:DNA-binding transcriptional MerR regulator
MLTARTYSLEDLCVAAGVPQRTVRYYIQLGLVDRPEGAGRGAHYLQRHLDQLLWVIAGQRKGLSLERIAELAPRPAAKEAPPSPRAPGSVEVWSRLFIGEGIELQIEPGRAGLTPEQVRALFRGVVELCERIKVERKR